MRNPSQQPGRPDPREMIGHLGRAFGHHVFGDQGHDDHGHHGHPRHHAHPEPQRPPEDFTGGHGFLGHHGFPGARGGGGFPGFPGLPGFPGGRGGFGPRGFGPGFGPGFGRGGRGGHGHTRPGRARRGDVRAAVLKLLIERPMHGYEMIKEIAERSGGWWRPSPGSVYPTLQLLADEGMVVTSEEGSGKRLYSLTEAGTAEAAKLDKTPPWEQEGDDADPENTALHDTLGGLMAAVYGVAGAASPELKTKAAKIVAEARRQLYLLLADAGFTEDDDVEDAVPDEN